MQASSVLACLASVLWSPLRGLDVVERVCGFCGIGGIGFRASNLRFGVQGFGYSVLRIEFRVYRALIYPLTLLPKSIEDLLAQGLVCGCRL